MEHEDFGFHDYESAMTNGDILVLSGFRILPNAGGWNDQFVTDAEDLLTYLRGLSWARGLKEGNNDRSSNAETEEDSTVEGVVKTGNWQSLI